MTTAETIWNEIKDVDLKMFSLPNQLVSNFCTPLIIEPSRLYLKFTNSAVLPFLVEVLGSKYNFEMIDRYISVSRFEGTK